MSSPYYDAGDGILVPREAMMALLEERAPDITAAIRALDKEGAGWVLSGPPSDPRPGVEVTGWDLYLALSALQLAYLRCPLAEELRGIMRSSGEKLQELVMRLCGDDEEIMAALEAGWDLNLAVNLAAEGG